MISREIEYRTEGRSWAGFFACDETRFGPRPAVLVCHEGTGLGRHAKTRALMLAEAGYAAYAPDLFGIAFRDRAAGVKAIQDLTADAARLRARARAALERLRACEGADPERAAAIGFCFGGMVALELARGQAPLDCVVSFHGGLQTQAPAALIAASVLVCTGAEDPFAPPERRAAFEGEMRAAKADWRMIVYAQTLHGFTNEDIDPAKSPGCAYNPLSDRRAWRAMLDLFEEKWGPATR